VAYGMTPSMVFGIALSFGVTNGFRSYGTGRNRSGSFF